MEGRALRTNSAQGVLQLQKNENSVAHVKAVLDRDRHLSVQLMAEEVGLPKTDVHRIITEGLHMKKLHTHGFFTTTMRQVTHHSL